jgi:hypothetical protein
MNSRSLALRRERLAELTSDDLGAVVAGAMPSGATCPVLDCLSGSVCNLTAQPRCA